MPKECAKLDKRKIKKPKLQLEMKYLYKKDMTEVISSGELEEMQPNKELNE